MHSLGVTRRRPKQVDSTMFGYQAPPDTPALQRDVFRWVQSLDMSHSIRNVRRDLANGFLVAEIFSRYFPNDVQMHSFDNGNSSKVKKDNWEQLERFSRKQEMEWPAELVQGTIDGLHGAAVALLEHFYQLFTGKKVQRLVSEADIAALPQLAGADLAGDANDVKGLPPGMKLINNQPPATPQVQFGTVQTKAVGDVAALRRKLAGQA